MNKNFKIIIVIIGIIIAISISYIAFDLFMANRYAKNFIKNELPKFEIVDSLENYDFEGEINKAMGYYDGVLKNFNDIVNSINIKENENYIKQEKTIKKEIDKPKFVITKDKNQTTIQRLPKKENKNIFIEIN